VRASRGVYEAVLVRARETGEQGRLDTNNVRIISKADLPIFRSWPPGNLILSMAALLFGVGSGMGLGFLREWRHGGAVQEPAPRIPRAKKQPVPAASAPAMPAPEPAGAF